MNWDLALSIIVSIVLLALVALTHFITYWPVLLGLKLLGKSLNARYLITLFLTINVSLGAALLLSEELSLRDKLHYELYVLLEYLVWSPLVALPVLLMMWWGDCKIEAKKRSS